MIPINQSEKTQKICFQLATKHNHNYIYIYDFLLIKLQFKKDGIISKIST